MTRVYIADQADGFLMVTRSASKALRFVPSRNATLTQQPDGMYHLVTTQDFNGW
ncbi:cadherin-like domain-containing protein [Vibrio chagasii]|nr:cadherin-like domain-containing protein [Vibrio chagasii]